MVATPPYSPVFARGLAALLREPVVSKALRSSDLDGGHRRALVAFVEAVAPAAEQAPVGAEEVDERVEGGAGAVVTPTKGERDGGEGMEVDHGEGNGVAKEGERAKVGPPPLLDAAMRKGLRLVYAQFLGGPAAAAAGAGGQGGGDA